MAESKEELKSCFMSVNEESEKTGLKLNIQKTKLMASGPIVMANRKGEKNSKSDIFFSLVSKITVDSGCDHEIKRCMFLGRNLR